MQDSGKVFQSRNPDKVAQKPGQTAYIWGNQAAGVIVVCSGTHSVATEYKAHKKTAQVCGDKFCLMLLEIWQEELGRTKRAR